MPPTIQHSYTPQKRTKDMSKTLSQWGLAEQPLRRPIPITLRELQAYGQPPAAAAYGQPAAVTYGQPAAYQPTYGQPQPVVYQALRMLSFFLIRKPATGHGNCRAFFDTFEKIFHSCMEIRFVHSTLESGAWVS